MPRILSERARYCLSNLFSLTRYTDILVVRTLSTHAHVAVFVGRIWRRNDWKIILGGLIVSAAAFLYDRTLSSENDTQHLITVIIGVGGLLASFWVAFIKLANLHRSTIFGGKKKERLTLSRRFFMELPPDGSQPTHSTIHDIVSPDASTELFHVGRKDKPVNVAAVDMDASRALLESQRIEIEPWESGALIEGNLRAQMKLTEQDYSDEQIDALQIMRRDAIYNRTSFFDSPKIALKSLEVGAEGQVRAKLGQTSYFATCLTNDLSTQCIVHADGSIDRDKPLDMFPAIKMPSGEGQRLLALKHCTHLSNHIGSMVLAVSDEGIPVLCFQGSGARINSGKVVASGAGSIDLADLAHSGADESRDLGQLIRYGMARELLEETGGVPQDTNRESDFEKLRAYSARIQLAGYYRDLRRGGLPIFVGFCRMERSFSKITSRNHESLCLFESPVETRVINRLERREVQNAQDMIDYLDNHIRGSAVFRCDPSDQLVLLREILRNPVMQEHFNRALAYAG